MNRTSIELRLKIKQIPPFNRCHNYSRKLKEERCRARCLVSNGKIISFTGGKHNHPPHTEKIDKISKKERERSSSVPKS